MSLLGIAIAQSSLGNNLVYPRLQRFFNDKVPLYSLFQYEDGCASFQKLWHNSGHVNLCPPRRLHSKFLIKATATLEPKFNSVFCEGQVDSSNPDVQIKPPNVDPEEVEDGEQARRMRISEANKGKTPWNKGRKHSPETLQRIKEATKLAMQNPKVKMKLARVRFARSREVKERIGQSLRLGWQRRRERLKIQELCLVEWQDLIAETARRGFFDEEELQWNSIEILEKQRYEERRHREMLKIGKHLRKESRIRRKRLKIQELCVAEWKDLIAETARRGFSSEEELQWNSYKILDEQLASLGPRNEKS